MRTGIYAIRDIKADDIIGGLHMHKHHAAAIRMFSDIAADEKTYISKHPEDYELLRLGYLDLDGTPPIAPELQTIITGVQWAAMQQKDQQTSAPPFGNNNRADQGTPLTANWSPR